MEADRSRKFSPSKLSTYENCPRRYRYRYVDGIKRSGQSVEAFLGTCVHSSFEDLYRALMHGRLMTEPEVVAAYEKAWDAGWNPEIKIRDKSYSPADWRKTGRDCVELYYRRHAPFDADKTVEVEKRIGFALAAAGEEVRIEGFIDRLALAPDGRFEIHDYKTGRSLPTQADVDEDWQLAIYDAAVREAWPDAPGVRLLWHYLRHGKTLESSRTPEQLAALKAQIAGLIGTIRADHEFAPKKTALCDWCEYRDLCPLFSHAEALEKLPPERRGQDAGLSLVDRLGELEGRKRELKDSLKELERQEEDVKAAIGEWAAERSVLVVAGTSGEAAISEKEEVKLPTKTHAAEALERLEAELKATPLWPEVSHLDGHRLLDGYKRKEWPQDLLDKVGSLLDRFGRRVKDRVVRYRRKRENDEE